MVFRGMNVKSFARTQKCLEFANIPTVATCKLLITLITIYHTKKKYKYMRRSFLNSFNVILLNEKRGNVLIL